MSQRGHIFPLLEEELTASNTETEITGKALILLVHEKMSLNGFQR